MYTLALLLFPLAFVTSEYTKHYHGPQAIPVVLHDGYLADTHEVAAAKNEHLAALAKASTYHGGYSGEQGSSEYGSAYHGPLAIPKVLPDGHIADTHEVAAAKSAHFAALAKYKSQWSRQYSFAGGHNGGDYVGSHGAEVEYKKPYHGPLAKVVVLPSGYLADTHEVAAAKAKHHEEVVETSHRELLLTSHHY